MRRVDGEESILRTELVEPKWGPSEDGRWGGCRKREQRVLRWRLSGRLACHQTAGWCGGKDAENSSQRRRFLPPFHRYRDLCGNMFTGELPRGMAFGARSYKIKSDKRHRHLECAFLIELPDWDEHPLNASGVLCDPLALAMIYLHGAHPGRYKPLSQFLVVESWISDVVSGRLGTVNSGVLIK
jgi:hypothetical protein